MNTTSVLPIDEFRTRVFWRWNEHQSALQAGLSVTRWGDPVSVNHGVMAHCLDSVDLYFRGHVSRQYNLRHANSEIRHFLEACKILKKDMQSAYEEIFWLVIDAWKDLMELELYEFVPTLKAALEKITGRFFKDQHRLTFPQDHTLSNDDLMLYVYNMEISEEWSVTPELPEDRLDILRNYPRHICSDTGKERGNEGEALRICYYMDDIIFEFRKYLLTPDSTLRRVFGTIDETLKQFPAMTATTLLTALFDKDMRAHLIKYEVWEVMPRFNQGWEKMKTRYNIA